MGGRESVIKSEEREVSSLSGRGPFTLEWEGGWVGKRV